ncbi:hypothetical protein Tco_1229333 [Tanacetum coccineum]
MSKTSNGLCWRILRQVAVRTAKFSRSAMFWFTQSARSFGHDYIYEAASLEINQADEIRGRMFVVARSLKYSRLMRCQEAVFEELKRRLVLGCVLIAHMDKMDRPYSFREKRGGESLMRGCQTKNVQRFELVLLVEWLECKMLASFFPYKALHPQPYGQSERTFSAIWKILLRDLCALDYCVTGKLGLIYLCLVEFAYTTNTLAHALASRQHLSSFLYGRGEESVEHLFDGMKLVYVLIEGAVLIEIFTNEESVLFFKLDDRVFPKRSSIQGSGLTRFGSRAKSVLDSLVPFLEIMERIGRFRFSQVRSRGSDFDIPVVFSLIIALLRNKTYTAYSDQLNMAYLSSDTVVRDKISIRGRSKRNNDGNNGTIYEQNPRSYSGSEHEDANEHIEKVLEIVDLFYIPKVTQDQIMLRAFHEVILFYNGIDVPTRQILDSKGVIPSKIVVDSKIAIQEMAEYSQKWHNGTSSRTGKYKTFEGYATSKLTQQSRTRNKESKCESVFCLESAKRHKENSNIIKEIRASTDAAIRNQGALIKILEIQIGQMSKVLQERGFGSLPSHERNPRDQVKSILTAKADFSGIRRIGCGLYVISGTQHRSILSETIPFPKRLQNFSCDDWRKAQDVKILDAYYHTLPPKEKDPWNFTLPCFIYNICFDKALVNLGASFTIIDDDDMEKDVVLGMKFCKKNNTAYPRVWDTAY